MSHSGNSPEVTDRPEVTVNRVWQPITVSRLAAKELKETLRDRRTMITLLLMPLLVYPILSLFFQGFLASGLRGTARPNVPGAQGAPSNSDNTTDPGTASTNPDSATPPGNEATQPAEPQFVYFLEASQLSGQIVSALERGFQLRQAYQPGSKNPSANGEKPLETETLVGKHVFLTKPPESNLTLEEHVARGDADVAILFTRKDETGEQSATPVLQLVYREGDIVSLEAIRLIESLLDAVNLGTMQEIGRSRRLSLPIALRYESTSVAAAGRKAAGISFAALIPLVLTLMTITGAVYPAIDLTAGERERGTLESLIAAPVPRTRILVGKLVAIVTVAVLTAVVNLIGMMITIWVFKLDTALFGPQGIGIQHISRIFALLVLFAVFFSSVLLVISSFARSFKEGQAYLIPLMMLSLVPAMISLRPQMQLEGVWAAIPLVNIVLLSRDILAGKAMLAPAIVAILTTVFYSALAISIASRFFGTAKVLYSDEGGIGTLFRRPRQATDFGNPSLALLCLALLFPGSFLWQGLLGRLEGWSTNGLVLMAAAGLVVVFVLVPLAIALFHKVRPASGFNLFWPNPVALIAAIFLGVGLAPLMLQLVGLTSQGSGSELLEHAKEQLERFQAVPFPLLILSLALAPAVCEELFFRGLLFRSFRSAMSPAATVVLTGVLFGAFHLITSSGLGLSRLFPTTLMGLVLGWVCLRSGSVIPGMILHFLHNSLTLSVAYFREELENREWISQDQSGIPVAILVGAAVLAAIGTALLLIMRPHPSKTAAR
jgi:sodium transport system permease protein